MSDKETGEKKTGWFKAFVGTVAGLASGAAVMYVTPFVDKAIKPAKPLANFEVKNDGLAVRIQNLSNVKQGHWDFGDGTPLLPVTEDEFVAHTYPGPGEYTVKLNLQNILNEENERSVVVKLNGAAATTPGTQAPQGPQITRFEVALASGTNSMAPATFKLTSDVQNAQTCVWNLGDGRIEVAQDSVTGHDQLVTFDKPGSYLVKLVAVNGKLRDEKAFTVNVAPPPAGVAKAVVSVTDVGKRVEKKPTTSHMSARFPQNQKENSFKFESQAKASMNGYTITDVRIPLPGNKELRLGANMDIALDANVLGQKAARNLHLTLSPDRTTLKLTGELVRSDVTKPPAIFLPVELIEQREIESGPSEMKLTRALGVPGPGSTFPSADTVVLPPLPPGASAANRQVRVELDDGQTIVLQPSQLPASGPVTVQNRRVMFNATRVNDQVKVSLTEPTTLRTTP